MTCIVLVNPRKICMGALSTVRAEIGKRKKNHVKGLPKKAIPRSKNERCQPRTLCFVSFPFDIEGIRSLSELFKRFKVPIRTIRQRFQFLVTSQASKSFDCAFVLMLLKFWKEECFSNY